MLNWIVWFWNKMIGTTQCGSSTVPVPFDSTKPSYMEIMALKYGETTNVTAMNLNTTW